MERQAIPGGITFSVWRWVLAAAALGIIFAHAPSRGWAAMVALPVLSASLVPHLFDREVFESWCSRGWLLIADALMVALALIAVGRPAAHLAAFFLIVMIATLVTSRLRTVLATATMLALVASVGTSAGETAIPLGRGDLWLFPLLFAAAIHFGVLGERLPSLSQGVERARRENDELRALLDITESIGRTLDPQEVMRSIARQVGEYVGTDSCSIVRADSETDHLRVVASKGHPEADALELKLEDYPEIRRALETRQPVIVDVTTDPLVAAARDTLMGQGYRSTLVLPLLYGEDVLGTLFVRTRSERPFGRDVMHFCQVAAGASANSLKNALLYEQVKREAERNRVTGEKMRRVLDATPDMIVATDVDGRITEINRGARMLTGRTAEQLEGKELEELLRADLEVADPGLADTEPRDITFRNLDGDAVEISLAGAPLHDAGGEVCGRVWIGRDVTRLRRVEKSLTQADRLSSLGEVVAGVAHELNNPLSGVVGYAQLLRVNAQADDQIRDLDRIVESALRCQKIVIKLLSFARKHPPEKKNQSLNDCVNKVLDLKGYHLKSGQITTDLRLDDKLPPTSFDFHQLEQVILNLLNNAEHAIASIKRAGEVRIETGVRDGMIYLEVEDNGPGVPAAARDRIFDPFFTTKDLGTGTGLGLSVSYGIVEEHGGRIELADATQDRGACFTVWLPLVLGPEAADEQPLEHLEREIDSRPLRGRQILVAEDEEMVLELFSRVLRTAGADVTLARDGEEAWGAIEKCDFDLIVADMRMPRLSGQGLYERATDEKPNLARKFVFATGDLARAETLDFLGELPNRILYKPLQVETLQRVLCQAIEAVSPDS